MDMRVKPLFSGGRKIARPDSATYVGELQLLPVWVSKTEKREAAVLVNHGGHRHEILPRLYHPQLVRILAAGFLLRGVEDYRAEGDRQVVFQEWRCELLEYSDGQFDRDWHPRIARALQKAGIPLVRDL